MFKSSSTMLMMRKYFLIWVISVVTSIICEQTWSQVMCETCTIKDSYVTSVVLHCRAACLFSPWFGSVCSTSRHYAHWQSSDGAALFRLHKKKCYHALKLHCWRKNSISEKCNYLNFKCWKPVLIIINYKFWTCIFLGNQIDRAGCKVTSTFNLYFILYSFWLNFHIQFTHSCVITYSPMSCVIERYWRYWWSAGWIYRAASWFHSAWSTPGKNVNKILVCHASFIS